MNKQYKLHVNGFSTGGGPFGNLLGTILDDDGKPIYNLVTETPKNSRGLEMDKNIPVIAVDGAIIDAKPFKVMGKTFSGAAAEVNNYDVTFFVKNADGQENVLKVRLNEEALNKLADLCQTKGQQA